MSRRIINVFAATKSLKQLVLKSFDDEKSLYFLEKENAILSGQIHVEEEVYHVKLITHETFRQFALAELEDDQNNITVFLNISPKRTNDHSINATVMSNGRKENIHTKNMKVFWQQVCSYANANDDDTLVNNPSTTQTIYKLECRPRGICLIINNKVFQSTRNGDNQQLQRLGTDIDAKNLHNVFDSFGFTVRTLENLTDSQIIQEVMRISLEDHSKFDIFVCCLLSHGRHGTILGVNNIEIPIEEITSTFRNRSCPTLANKPKLFFIQACQGQRPQRGVVQADVYPSEPSVRVLPDGSDFLVACSSEPGYESFRHPESGSFFINSLVKHLKHFATESLLNILTKVCLDVSETTFDGNYKQVPWFTSTLTKMVVFKQ